MKHEIIVPRERNPHLYGTQEFCGWMNVRLTRRDIEWVPDGKGGILLVDRQDWSGEHARSGKEHAERERRAFNHRRRHPVSDREAAQ